MGEELKEWIKVVVSAAVLALVITQFVVPTSVSGSSMEPAFSDRDYLLVSKQAYVSAKQPQRGDVVVFQTHLKDEEGQEKKLIKRVVALPGEIVSIENGKVYINGEELQETYTADGVTRRHHLSGEGARGLLFLPGRQPAQQQGQQGSVCRLCFGGSDRWKGLFPALSIS